MEIEQDVAPAALFRHTKRRKLSKARPRHEVATSPIMDEISEKTEAHNTSDDAVSSDAMRFHRSKARRAGVVFSAANRGNPESGPATSEVSAPDEAESHLLSIADRFEKTSGQVVDVDKHMSVFMTPP